MAQFSTKRIAIDKAYATLLIAISTAVFISVFSIVASKSLLDQRAYQSKVLSKKETALKNLKSNITAADQLTTSYKGFSEATTNVLGGNPKGDADRDGDNPRIILDALPSKYDFPALTTSIEKLLKDHGFKITSITGTDDEVAQQTDGNPQPIDMPFTVEVTTSDNQGKTLLELFEHSIRPFQMQTLNLAVQNGELVVTINSKSYFQPKKSLDVKKEVVK